MNESLYPVLNPDPDWWDENICGDFIGQALKKLDKIAKKNKRRTLSSFISMRRDEYIINELKGDPNDPTTFDPLKVKPEHWHNPEEGLKTIRVLLDYTEENPHKFINPSGIISDLEVIERVLTRATQENLHWHLGQKV